MRDKTTMNGEGMTWEEWACAATIPYRGIYTGHTHIAIHFPAALFRKERRAWRAGEDPTEWRKALDDQRHAKYVAAHG